MRIYAACAAMAAMIGAYAPALAQETDQRPPIVVVPGILGSELRAGSCDGDVVWGDVWGLSRAEDLTLTDGPNDALDPLLWRALGASSTRIDPSFNYDVPSDGLVACAPMQEIPFFGRAFEVRPYQDLAEALRVAGYCVVPFLPLDAPAGAQSVDRGSMIDPGILRGPEPEDCSSDEAPRAYMFAYDWRRSTFAGALALARFIEARIPGDHPVDLLAHSMGGLVAEIVVKRYTTGERVRRYMTVGTPFRGSLNTFLALEDGLGGGFTGWVTRTFNGIDAIRDFMFSLPSFYELLPRTDDCCEWYDAIGPEQRWFQVHDDGTDAHISAWERLSLSYPQQVNPAFFETSATSFERQAILNAIVDEPFDGCISVVAISNNFAGTAFRLTVDKSGGIVFRRSEDGDGVVTSKSAFNGPKRRRNRACTPSVEYDREPDIVHGSHTSYFNNDRFIRALRIFASSDPVSNISGALNAPTVFSLGGGARGSIARIEFSVKNAVPIEGVESETSLNNAELIADAELRFRLESQSDDCRDAIRLDQRYALRVIDANDPENPILTQPVGPLFVDSTSPACVATLPDTQIVLPDTEAIRFLLVQFGRAAPTRSGDSSFHVLAEQPILQGAE